MTKQNKILITVLVVVIITAFLLWPKKSKAQKVKEQLSNENGNATSTNNTRGAAASITPSVIPGVPVDVKDAFPLKMGSRGDRVRRLQQILNLTNKHHKTGVPFLVEDGIFGAKTDKAVRMWFSNGQISQSTYDVINHLFLKNNPIPLAWKNQNSSMRIDSISGLSFNLLKL